MLLILITVLRQSYYQSNVKCQNCNSGGFQVISASFAKVSLLSTFRQNTCEIAALK